MNPAFAGLINEQNFDLQIQSYLDNPKFGTTAQLSYSNKIAGINSGIGFIFSNSKTGYFTDTKMSVLYNYQFNVGSEGKLSLGTALKYKRQNIDYSGLVIMDSDDYWVSIIEGSSTSSNFDFDLGVLYQIKNFYISANSINLLQSNHNNGDGWLAPNTRTFNVYVMNDFRFREWLKFTPSLSYKTNFNGNWFLDVNAICELQKWILLGSTFRADENDLFGIYNVGLNIRDKVQIITKIYGGDEKGKYAGNAFELMITAKIKNE